MNGPRSGYPYKLGAPNPFALPPAVMPPCPLCSEKVKRDEPAAQALAWGVLIAKATPGASNFWRAMAAAESYRSSGESHSAIDDMVSAGLRVVSEPNTAYAIEEHRVWLDDDNIRFGADDDDEPVVPVHPAPEVVTDPWAGALVDCSRPMFKGIGSGADGLEGGKETRFCCVQDFKYPKAVKKYEIFADMNAFIGFEFDVEATFKEGSKPAAGEDTRGADEQEKVPGVCRCACCRFRQYIAPPGPDPKTLTRRLFFPTYKEDCFFWYSDPARQRGLGSRPTWGTDEPPPDAYVDCPGIRPSDYEALPPGSPLMPCLGSDGSPTGGTYGDGPAGAGCHFSFTDHPGEVVDYGEQYSIRLDLVGRILDFCNEWVQRATGRLVLEREGKVDPTGLGLEGDKASASSSADGPDAALEPIVLPAESSRGAEPDSESTNERVCATDDEVIEDIESKRSGDESGAK